MISVTLRRTLAITAFLGLSATVSPPARADVTPPEEDACQGKAAGDPCTARGKKGACATDKCFHFDYPNWDRDASPTPPKTEYECRLCKPNADADADAGTVSGSSASESSGCSSSSSRPTPWPLLMLPVGLVFFVLRRRRNA